MCKIKCSIDFMNRNELIVFQSVFGTQLPLIKMTNVTLTLNYELKAMSLIVSSWIVCFHAISQLSAVAWTGWYEQVWVQLSQLIESTVLGHEKLMIVLIERNKWNSVKLLNLTQMLQTDFHYRPQTPKLTKFQPKSLISKIWT